MEPQRSLKRRKKSPDDTKSLLKRNTPLHTLNHLSSIISQPSLEKALGEALDQLLVITRADIGTVHVIDPKAQDLKLIASRGVSPCFVDAESRIPLGACLCGEAALTGKPVFSPDLAATDPRLSRTACRDERFRSVVSIPLKSRERVLGVLTIYAKQPHHFSSMDQDLLVLVGHQMGLTIENAQLHERTRELAVLEERRLIAQEIHDGIAQSLAYLNLETLRLEELLKTHPQQQALSALAEIRREIQSTYEDIRELLIGFRAKFNEDESLSEVLDRFVRNFSQRTGIQVDIVHPRRTPPLTPTAQIQVFRIIQEALANIRKHASAQQATVILSSTPHSLEIQVRDNGIGFDPQEISRRLQSTMGLEIMKERVSHLRGSLQMESQPGKGTTLLIRIPLEPAHAA